MLVFDQLKKEDPQLRLVAIGILTGLGVLFAGLWWVQIVSARDYQENLETQSFRTVRIPAVRGKILDCNGNALAENRPTYNISLYLAEIRGQFQKEYQRLKPTRIVTNTPPLWQRWFKSPSVTTQYARLSKSQISALTWESRYRVASNVVQQVSENLKVPLLLDRSNFIQHYEKRLVLPLPVLTNATPVQIARFAEKCVNPVGIDLELQSVRVYPYETTAAHVLGSLQRDDSSRDSEEAFFSYRLPDYKGVLGIEYGYDKELRGQAGSKSVLVNSLGYRQNENIWTAAEAGHNIRLTLDVGLQQVAERALLTKAEAKRPIRGAVVVMDVNTGDLLVMASQPTVNPNDPIRGFSKAEMQRRLDPELKPERNRATQENYQPGSIFKTVVGMAALEKGLNPDQVFESKPNPADPSKALYYVGNQSFKDTAAPGSYNFRRALIRSSNSYFIDKGLWTGAERIVALGQRLHFGEPTGLPTRQDSGGNFPSLEKARSSAWRDGNTALTSIGQGEIDITPVQVAVLISAIANGGTVLWPRLVDRIEPQDPTSNEAPVVFPSGRVRDELGLKPRTLKLLRDAMLADVEDHEGTGKASAVPGLRICGKTGTAQKKNAQGVLEEHITWFASFAPYEKPRYAVVVVVEGGVSGGTTCAPVAHEIYAAIQERSLSAGQKGAVANAD
jgi:penicillin-binding protein 2